MAIAEVATSTVNTPYGLVRGTIADGIHVFRGIPYAAPPFGTRRLREPEPPAAWAGVRDAFVDGAKPPQPTLPGFKDQPWDRAPIGEDCLNLNIWTPDPAATGLPVMIWITGGSFRAGSNAWYDGSRFARDGVVCVAINYRSGPEGFLHVKDATPNRGLLDQIAAAEWVRDNIASFGGDPRNVTLCGESAGAMCIGMLLAVPRARGLFHRAILQSGAASFVVSADAALRIGERFAEKLGVAPTQDALAKVPPDALIATHLALDADVTARPDPAYWGVSMAGPMLTQPVVDGDVIPSLPLERIASGSAADVDIIVGSNTDDWRLFLAFTGDLAKISDDMLEGPVARYGANSVAAYGLPAERTLAAYRRACPGATPGDVLAAIQTDWWIRLPALRLADAHVSSGSRTYMYEFDWASPVGNGLFGACHALEIPFVFDTIDRGPGQMLGDLLGPSAPQELATKMHRAWVSFVSSGDAGWPAYRVPSRETMRFGTSCEVVADPRARERALWQGVR